MCLAHREHRSKSCRNELISVFCAPHLVAFGGCTPIMEPGKTARTCEQVTMEWRTADPGSTGGAADPPLRVRVHLRHREQAARGHLPEQREAARGVPPLSSPNMPAAAAAHTSRVMASQQVMSFQRLLCLLKHAVESITDPDRANWRSLQAFSFSYGIFAGLRGYLFSLLATRLMEQLRWGLALTFP